MVDRWRWRRMLRRRIRVRPTGGSDSRKRAEAGERGRHDEQPRETQTLDPMSVDRYLPHSAAYSRLFRGQGSAKRALPASADERT